jgi:hypothetical protein|nr:hypothetical protein [Candidatus Acidoferrales bacterium]
MTNIIDNLRGGDRRSIGRSGEVAELIAKSPKLFAEVVDAAIKADPVIRMRAADAIEKASANSPALLQPHIRVILNKIAVIPQQEVRWHVAQILPRLKLTPKERDHAVSILFDYLEDKSSIVKTFAMQGLSDFAQIDPRLRTRILPILAFLTANGTAAMRARGRMLLAKLKR